MSSERLIILNALPEAAWDEMKQKPRFLQPHDHSKAPCRHCVGTCCQADIRTTTVEAIRIALTLGVPVLDFIEPVDAAVFADSATEWPVIPVDGAQLRLRLRKVDTWCIWLHRVNGRGRCSIHALRPGPCRLYPFEMQVGERRVTTGNQNICPVGWVKTDALEEQAHADLRAFDADMAAERALIDAWTAARVPGGVEEYLRWAVAHAGPGMGLDVEEYLRPRRAALGKRLW